jgi:voltage-gated potassium channel
MMNCPFLENALTWLQGLNTELSKQKSLGYVLFLAVGITILFGFAVFLIDPNVHSFSDGVWYAWVTMTHVGYGDVVPTSFLGRVLACLLILFGLAVLALLTATFSSILIGRDMGGMARDESQILNELKRLHERLDRLEASQLHETGSAANETGNPQME